jgi:hypothetical protein
MALNAAAKKWVEALRSRKFKQTYYKLSDGEKYCCLGVLCELAVEDGIIKKRFQDEEVVYYGKGKNYVEALLPNLVQKWAGLSTSDGDFKISGRDKSLTFLNDLDKKSFSEIATVIESEPDGLFRKRAK